MVCFLGSFPATVFPRISLLLPSGPLVKLAVVGFVFLGSSCVSDLSEGLGLGIVDPLQVAEAGNLGGGILSCLQGCDGTSLLRSVGPF